MQQTKERPGSIRRTGLFRRFIQGGDGSGVTRHRVPPDVIDLRGAYDPDGVEERIERLEIGMRMIVETMKRSYGRLAATMDALGAHSPVGTTVEDVQRVVTEALQPVASSLDEVAEALRGFPYLVAAAADHVTERVDEARTAASVEAALPPPQASSDIAVLPIVPFDMEPVEEEFDTLTALRRARFNALEVDAGWENAVG
jgi:hypothetical protein